MLFDSFWEKVEADREALLALGEQRGITLGEQRGEQRGIALGDQRMRDLVMGQVTMKFGSPTADSLSGYLGDSADAEQIAEVGGWVVECQSREDLLRRATGKAG